MLAGAIGNRSIFKYVNKNWIHATEEQAEEYAIF